MEKEKFVSTNAWCMIQLYQQQYAHTRTEGETPNGIDGISI